MAGGDWECLGWGRYRGQLSEGVVLTTEEERSKKEGRKNKNGGGGRKRRRRMGKGMFRWTT